MRKTQRILATTLALAVGLSTVGVSLSALAEEVPMTPASAEPRILPPDSPLPPGEQRRVRGGDVIRFGGTADPGARLVQGRMVTYTPAGAVDQSYVLSSLRLENGQFSGQTTYPGPNSTDAHDGRLVLEVTLAMGEEDDALQVATSNPLRIDLVRPYIVGSALVAPDTVRVKFSEPVHVIDPVKESDMLIGWKVDGNPPVDVASDSDRSVRYLKIVNPASSSLKYDEDATPAVGLDLAKLPSHWYLDNALWRLSDVVNRSMIAVDRIAPKKPNLVSIAGKANDGTSQIASNDATPTFELSGLRPGHVGQVYLESNETEGFQAGGDALLAEAPADDEGRAVVTLDETQALEDAEYRLYGVARDRAKCEPSKGTSPECPNHSSAAAGFYLLDTIVPRPEFAVSALDEEGNPHVNVRFSEPVRPDGGSTEDWTVAGNVVTGVSGTALDAHRRLDVQAHAGAAVVTWAPGEGSGHRYADRAGNALAPFSLTAFDSEPPIVTLNPNIDRLVDAAAVYLRSSSCGSRDLCYRLSGGVSRATHIQVYRKVDDDWIAVSDQPKALNNGNTYTGSWSYDVDLLPNATNRFRVEPLRLAAASTITGPRAETRPIIHDNEAPVVNIDALGQPLHDGSVGYEGGATATISWEIVSERNLVHGPVRLEYSLDGGQSWDLIKAGLGSNSVGRGSYAWTVPSSRSATTENAMVRAVVTDAVGLTTRATTPRFVIDAEPPTFTAYTQLHPGTNEPTQVRVVFSEPIKTTGQDPQTEWAIHHRVGDRSVPIPVSSAQEMPDRNHPALVREILLTTGFVDGAPAPVQQKLDPNGSPTVEYRIDDDNPLFDQLRDRADQGLDIRSLPALDRIAPKPVKADSLAYRNLVRRLTETVAGRAIEDDPRNTVIFRRERPGAIMAGAVGSDGRFQVPAALARDRVNEFRVWVKDEAENMSEAIEIAIENDLTAPVVRAPKPKGIRRSGKRYLKVRWSTVERNKDAVTIHFRLGSNRASWRRMVLETPDDGFYRWRVPSRYRGKAVQVRITAMDKVGNSARKSARWSRLPR